MPANLHIVERQVRIIEITAHGGDEVFELLAKLRGILGVGVGFTHGLENW